MPSTSNSRPFYPALDGLRAVAFLAVFISHYGPVISTWAPLRNGWIGVDIFFVLSGFLITGILYDDLDAPHYFRSFCIRRALRIFPLFYGFWFLLALLNPVLGIVWTRYNLATVVYIGNYFNAGGLAHLHADPGLLLCRRLFAHGGSQSLDLIPLWSLCVEEQFYIVWPAIVATVRSRSKLLILCLAVMLISPVLRGLYWHLSPDTARHGATYFNTLTHLDGLLCGGAISLWLRGPARVSNPTWKHIAYGLALTPLPVLWMLVAMWSPNFHAAGPVNWINDPIVNTIGLSLVALFAAGLLLLALHSETWLYKVLQTRVLKEIGRRSYGLYLLHAVPLFLFAGQLLPRLQLHHLGILFIPIALFYTFSASWLSYRYLESPFLRLKDRLAPTPARISEPIHV